MKQFKSFTEAILYHTNCVICHNKLSINDRDLVENYYTSEDNISFYLSKHNNLDDIVSLNTKTDEVFYVAPEYSSGHGAFIHGLSQRCERCCQFAYNIQIHIDLGLKKITGIFLNSETISIEENDMVHEIRNVYATEQTEYVYFPRDGSTKKSTIPLIPLDLQNPIETALRIRKLLIFS